jgi:hypothetical protein
MGSNNSKVCDKLHFSSCDSLELPSIHEFYYVNDLGSDIANTDELKTLNSVIINIEKFNTFLTLVSKYDEFLKSKYCKYVKYCYTFAFDIECYCECKREEARYIVFYISKNRIGDFTRELNQEVINENKRTNTENNKRVKILSKENEKLFDNINYYEEGQAK